MSGLIEAPTRRQARVQLRATGLYPIDIRPANSVRPGSRMPFRRRPLRGSRLVMFTQQWASLLEAGLTTEQALLIISEQDDSPCTRQLLLGIRSDIVAGHQIADALASHTTVFSPIYRSLVAVGEKSGSLAVVLQQLSTYLGWQAGARAQALQALIYPAIVTVVALAVVLALMTWVVPQVTGVFLSGRHALPWMTRMLVAISSGFSAWGAGLLVCIVLAAVALRMGFHQHPSVRLFFHRSLLNTPVLGGLMLNAEAARFASTLSILVGNGVPLIDSLEASRESLALLPLRAGAISVIAEVREGGTLSAALAKSGGFPPLLAHLAASGESTGRLRTMLERGAQVLQRDVEARMGTLLRFVEPLAVLVMGGVVLFIVVAVMLPLVQINQFVR